MRSLHKMCKWVKFYYDNVYFTDCKSCFIVSDVEKYRTKFQY